MTIHELLERGRLNAKLPTYQRKKEVALKICEEQLKLHSAPYCALSGGKDSVAMCYIVNEAAKRCRKDFRLWSHLSDASFPGTRETCLKVAESIGRELDTFESTSALESVNNKKRMAFGKRGVFFDSVREYAKYKDLAFVGVRAFESKRRMKAAKAHGMCFHSESMGNIDVVNPLQWFRLIDVASVLYEYNAPIHPIYTKYCTDVGTNSNGEPLFIRLGYITSKDLLDKGTAVFMKMNYPAVYNDLMQRFPELRNYV